MKAVTSILLMVAGAVIFYKGADIAALYILNDKVGKETS